MARYVGPAVVTAIVAAVYAEIPERRLDDGESAADALASGFRGGALVLTIVSALGILLMYLVRGYRQRTATGVDVAIAAAGFSHTIPRPESA